MVYGIRKRNRGDRKRTLTIGEADLTNCLKKGFLYAHLFIKYSTEMYWLLPTSYYGSDIVVDTSQ